MHLAQGELQHYIKELEWSNQELDDFAYIASHDLKEPLRGINNYAAFLLEDYEEQLDDDGQAKLQTLIKLSKHLETLISDLLQFSRIGRAELARKETDMVVLVREIVDSLQYALQEQGVTVTVAEDLPTLICDYTRIGEVFRNLITNAMKYNDKEDKHIEIGWLAVKDDEPVFFIRDNGIGIRAKHLDKIFLMFKRLHGRNKFGGGSGAGLTLTRKIIERHGGRIWVESIWGEGTTFFFTLKAGQPEMNRNE